MVAPSSRRPSTCGFATPAKLSTLASGTLESSGCGYPSSSAQPRPVGKMKSSPGSVETVVYAFWISSRRTSTSIGEDGCAIAHELHQRGCALQLGVVDQIALVELTVVEADRAYVKAPALLDELVVEELDRRLHAFANRGDIPGESEANPFRSEPENDFVTAIERGSCRQVGHRDRVGVVTPGRTTDPYP